ncbi:hypothetical protein AGOR_G00169640 [Albula goreensis]|uniref:Tripartite motif-containing protein 35-like n=1 Tax=Albula goreensis TaxID=1534307 RepID=A0A8T3D2A6_9TELE|nr:hypothetical protein AGOR_G00169640 [Albula goreensis]
MASSVSISEEDLLCPVCHKIFSFPVTLKCGHNTCKVCVQTFWEWRGSRECPVCRRESSSDRPPIDLELKIAADELKQQKLERVTLSPDAQCGLHHEQLKLFCVIDQEPICIICQTSKKHRLHICCPVEEAALERKNEISNHLTMLEKQLKALNTMKEGCSETERYLQVQAEQTERHIKREFMKLHTFLRDEEMARVKALREEEEKKIQIVKEKIESITKKIALLSYTISELQKDMAVDDVPFLQDYKQMKTRAQNKIQQPDEISGALIDVSAHLGSLKFHVWKKMVEVIQYSPISLDPNTAHPNLTIGLELTGVKYNSKQKVPDNPERCISRLSVMAAQGFSSDKHSWEVDVGENKDWCIGVAKESAPRKKSIFLNPEEGSGSLPSVTVTLSGPRPTPEPG